MTKTPPLISILIPCFNHAAFLEALMLSIWRQPCAGLEIILVDDGSSDQSHEIALALAQSSPVTMQVIRQSNQGINTALNRALAQASGTYTAIIASDDLFADDRFSAQVGLIETRPALHLVYGNGRYWRHGQLGQRVHGEDMQRLLHGSPQVIRDYLVTHVPALFIQSCLFRTDFLRRIGGFDASLLADDWPLNIRMFSCLAADEFAYVDEDVFYYRQHGSSSHRNYMLHARRILEVIEKFTPDVSKPAFLAEQHSNLAMLAISNWHFRDGLRHILASQRLEPNLFRLLSILFKLLRYPFKKAIHTWQ